MGDNGALKKVPLSRSASTHSAKGRWTKLFAVRRFLGLAQYQSQKVELVLCIVQYETVYLGIPCIWYEEIFFIL